MWVDVLTFVLKFLYYILSEIIMPHPLGGLYLFIARILKEIFPVRVLMVIGITLYSCRGEKELFSGILYKYCLEVVYFKLFYDGRSKLQNASSLNLFFVHVCEGGLEGEACYTFSCSFTHGKQEGDIGHERS